MSESASERARRVVIVVCPECKQSFVTRSTYIREPCSECGEVPPAGSGDETHQS